MNHGGLTGFFTCHRNSRHKLPRGVQKVYDRVRRDLLPVGVCYEAKDHEVISETIERDETGREFRLQTLRVRPQEELKSDDEAYQRWERRHKRCRPAACADVFEAAARRVYCDSSDDRETPSRITRTLPIEAAAEEEASEQEGEQSTPQEDKGTK